MNLDWKAQKIKWVIVVSVYCMRFDVYARRTLAPQCLRLVSAALVATPTETTSEKRTSPLSRAPLCVETWTPLSGKRADVIIKRFNSPGCVWTDCAYWVQTLTKLISKQLIFISWMKVIVVAERVTSARYIWLFGSITWQCCGPWRGGAEDGTFRMRWSAIRWSSNALPSFRGL